LLLTATLVASACGPKVSTTTPTAATTTAAAASPPTLTPAMLPTPLPEAQPAVDQAVQDAAGRLSVSAGDLRVDQVEARQWPDASLGCPQPGLLYSQIVTPGFLIVISSTSGRQLEYHADSRGRVVLCKES
jgi:hypothetical protein